MRAKILVVAGLFVCLALFFGPALVTSATAKGTADSRARAKQANWSLSEAGQRDRADVGFPYTASGLLLISFSTGLALVTGGLGLKVWLSHRR